MNILTTSVLEVFGILCWYSSWSLADVIISMMTRSILVNIVISLVVGLFCGLVPILLQIPLLYFFK